MIDSWKMLSYLHDHASSDAEHLLHNTKQTRQTNTKGQGMRNILSFCRCLRNHNFVIVLRTLNRGWCASINKGNLISLLWQRVVRCFPLFWKNCPFFPLNYVMLLILMHPLVNCDGRWKTAVWHQELNPPFSLSLSCLEFDSCKAQFYLS